MAFVFGAIAALYPAIHSALHPPEKDSRERYHPDVMTEREIHKWCCNAPPYRSALATTVAEIAFEIKHRSDTFYSEKAHKFEKERNLKKAIYYNLKRAKTGGAPGRYDIVASLCLRMGDTDTPRKVFHKLAKKVKREGGAWIEDLAKHYNEHGYQKEAAEEYIKINYLWEVSAIFKKLITNKKDIKTAKSLVEIIENLAKYKKPVCKRVYKRGVGDDPRGATYNRISCIHGYDNDIKRYSEDLIKYLSDFPNNLVDRINNLRNRIEKANEKIGKNKITSNRGLVSRI